MLSALLSRLIILVFGTLYPAYASHKAVKTKNVKEYVKWMMYWIVFALYTFVEIFTDVFVSFWMPFYYEVKIGFVLWLASPTTRGSSYIYRKIIHPYLQSHEDQFDAYLDKIWEHGYDVCRKLGSHGLTFVAECLADLLKKGQLTVVTKLPTLMELAQETGKTISSHAPAETVDGNGGGADIEDYDIVEAHEVHADGFPGSEDFEFRDSSSKNIPSTAGMDVDREEGTTVSSRPLVLQPAHRSAKEDVVEDPVPAATKSGKVRHRKTNRK